MNDSNSPKRSSDEDAAQNKEVIEEVNIGEVRHDEPVTAKGIVRSLFMANEPEQRVEVEDSGNQTDPKSSD